MATSRKISIPYVVVPARSGRPSKPPVVFMGGGPGSGTIQLAGYLANGVDLAADRDVVLLEQRGGDRATPDLSCPAADAQLADMFTHTSDPYDEAKSVADAMRSCLDAFVASGGDPRGYTAGEAALDLRDLRIKLGYPHWSLYGLSWSTGVMARLAAIDPSGVDAVVLDSFSPPSVDFAQNGYDGLRDSLDALGQRAGGDLSHPYDDLMTTTRLLNTTPQNVPGHNPVTHENRIYRLTGDDLVTLVHSAAYDVNLLPILPLLLHRLAAGHFDALHTLVSVGIGELVSHNLGQYWFMQCQDEVPYRRAGAHHARPVIAWLAADDVVCARLGLPPASATTREPVTFKQPTLILAGAEDPITPARVADQASEGLPRRQFVEFTGIGHAVVLSSDCGRTLIAAWLDQPSHPLDQCQTQPPYAVVQPNDLHPAARLAAGVAGATDGRILPIIAPALLVLVITFWAVGWVIWMFTRFVRRQTIRPGQWFAVPPLAGLLFLATFGGLLWSEYDELPARLLLGVPKLAPWTGLLLLVPLPIWRQLARKAPVLGRVGLAAGVLIWLAGAAWFMSEVVLPS
ncbi:alpha/beta fold hydrolase [Kribbella sp. GL6]|uniref:alpha/beta fold hydrolase n=1 Tax=Kribbella sp. GL6 TaxID=3419765 RepID=UPI003D0738CD